MPSRLPRREALRRIATAGAACGLVGCGETKPTVDLLAAAGWRAELRSVLAAIRDDPAAAATLDHIDLRLRYGGSGQLVGLQKAGARCDLFLAADASYLDALTVCDRLPIRSQRAGLLLGPGAAVPDWGDLLDGRATLSIARAESAAISRVVREHVGEATWDRLKTAAKIHRFDVVEAANDAARLNVCDAALVWDTTAARYPDCRFVVPPELAGAVGSVELGVLTDRPVVIGFAAAIAAGLRGGANAAFARLQRPDRLRLALQETLRPGAGTSEEPSAGP